MQNKNIKKMDTKINIKELLNEWKEEVIKNLKNRRYTRTINLYLIPKEWEKNSYIINNKFLLENLDKFKKEIFNDGKAVIPQIEFSFIKEEYIKFKEKENFIKKSAEYSVNKLVIDLGSDNYYFYYLDNENNICEGYSEHCKNGIDENYVDNFNSNTIKDFTTSFLKNKEYEIENKKVTFFLSNDNIVFKNDPDLINHLKNINNKNDKKIESYKKKIPFAWGKKYKTLNDDNNEEKYKDNKDIKEIIECIVNYHHFSSSEIYPTSKIPIDEEWMKFFVGNYYTRKNKDIIYRNSMDKNNYSEKLDCFKNSVFNIEKKEITSPKEVSIIFKNKTYTFFKNYELVNHELFNILSKYFGKEKNKNFNKVDVNKLDNKYFLVKYNKTMIEIFKERNKNDRYLIIGQNNIEKNLLKELEKNGFDCWVKNNQINLSSQSNEIIENDKELGIIFNLKEIKDDEFVYENIDFKDDRKSFDNENTKNSRYANNINSNKIRSYFKDKNKERKEKENNKKYNNFIEKIEKETKESDYNHEKDYKHKEFEQREKVGKKQLGRNVKNNTINTEKPIKYNENIEKDFDDNDIEEEELNYDKTPRGLIGLQNVGATCYMNAGLQCLSNIPKLRTYFLNNKMKIKKPKTNVLSSSLLTIFENLWENKKIKYFVPQEFKNIISDMNPLFEGIQANDTKDLILFILETIHNELNIIKNINIDDDDINPKDYNSVFKSFFLYFQKNYNSIISNLFFGMNNSMMTCCNCNITVHNVQCFNILFFPLEEVRKFKGIQQNVVNIYDCFDFNQKQDFLIGANQIICNHCHQMANAVSQTKIIISPNVLIINLNRGRGLLYNIKIIFEEFLKLRNYIYYDESPHYYELIGVVSHLGGSDMSGHFIAFCKNSENLKWYKYNDSIVTESSFQEVISFGVPYVLFYNYIQT